MMLSPTRSLAVRGSDPVARSGGLFGASRLKTKADGSTRPYKHDGLDLTTIAWEWLYGVHKANIEKIGIAYPREYRFHSLHMSFRIGNDDYWVVLLYVWPTVQVGQTVLRGQVIALAEDLTVRYKRVKNHTHMIVKKNGRKVDPLPLLEAV